MPDAEAAAERARLLFRLLAGLSLAGVEGSFKLSEQQLLRNRFLVGIERRDLTDDRFLAICRELRMPEEDFAALRRDLAGANQVLFGFEENTDTCVYKVYLEFWERVHGEIQRTPRRRAPLLLHLGFKWDALEPTPCKVTRYHCHPKLGRGEILARVTELYAGLEPAVSRHAATAIIELASRRAAASSFLYLEATEAENSRRSFDINIYNAGLRVAEIRPFLSRACDRFRIPSEAFDGLYSAIRRSPLGHIAGGRDRLGRDFLTTYYETRDLPFG